jgi:hypothetical protein
LTERYEPALRHAVDDLPAAVVARQAERAGWLKVATRRLSPRRLPGTLALAPGLAHRRNARLLGMVAGGFLALFAVSALVAGGLDEPVIVALSLLPPATAAAGALWHLAKERAAPARLTLVLSKDGVEIDADRRRSTTPLAAFEGIALRVAVVQKASPQARRHRTVAETRGRVGNEIRLHRVELTHVDPTRSVPLWASDAPFAGADGLAAARGFAAALGLPLLSTAGIASVRENEDLPPTGPPPLG